MIDDQTLSSELATPASGSQGSAGQLLRAAREAAGLHIATLAVALKVPVKKLEALEAGRYDQLPDVVFSRALASSVCRHLKMDPAPILALLPQTVRQQLSDDDAHLNTRFPSEPAHVNGVSLGISPLAVGAVAALLLLAAVILYWPQIQSTLALFIPTRESRVSATVDTAGVSGGTGAMVDATRAASVAGGTQTPVRGEAVGTPNGVPATVAQAATPTVPVSALPLPVPRASAAAAVPAASTGVTGLVRPTAVGAVAASQAATIPAAQAGQSLMTLTARGSSWVDVTDARGTSVFRKTLQTGETAEVSGVPPLSAVIGRADLTEVRVRGRGFDMTPYVRDNVARFEVK